MSIGLNLENSIDAIKLIFDPSLENEWKLAARKISEPIKSLSNPYTDSWKKATKEANSLVDQVVDFPSSVAEEFRGADDIKEAFSEVVSPGLVELSTIEANTERDYQEAIASIALIAPEDVLTYSQADGDWKALNEPLENDYPSQSNHGTSNEPYEKRPRTDDVLAVGEGFSKPIKEDQSEELAIGGEFGRDFKNETLAVPLQNDQDDEELSRALAARSVISTEGIVGYAAQFTNLRSSAVELMARSGADFQQNAFDCFLVCTPRTTPGETAAAAFRPMDDFFDEFYKNNAVFGEDLSSTKPFGDAAAFAVRVQSINVPQALSETFEVPFLYTKIRKVRSKVALRRKAKLSIRMDEPLYFATFVNLASNNNNVALEFGTRPAMFAPFTTTNVFSDNLVDKAIRADLYVSHSTLMNGAWKESVLNNQDRTSEAEFVKFIAGLPADELPAWCFEDVNFLGMTNEVEFDRDSASTMEGAFEFVFKRVYKMDFQRRTNERSRRPSTLAANVADLQNGQAWFYGKN